MSGSYTQIFGGGVTNSVYPSYQLFALTALNSPLQLVWPSEFVTSNNFTSNIIEFSATVGGLAFKMPPANLVSVGMATLFTNLSAFNVTLFANDGTTTITTFPPSSSTYVYLINNSTTNGQFRVVPWGGGFPAVVSIAAVSTSPDLLITGSPVTSSGTFTFSFSGDINNIINVSGTGILTKTAPNTWSTRTITGTPNQITVVNGSGVAGNPTISLPAAVSGIISLTASNVRLGFSGTNTIDTADGNPLIVNDDLSITPTGGIANDLRFYAGNGLKFVAFKGPTAAVADVTWTLPNADATVAGMVLSSNAAGVLSWITPASGTVNSVTGTAGQIVAAPTTGAVVLSLANTAVAPGAYTTANITVDAFGRITAASNGSPTENDATLINTIAQPGHALVVGDWVYFNGVNYVKAKADALLTAEVLGMVTNVVNPNSFVLTMYGYVPGTAGLAGLIAGDVYWLSDATAGLMTNTKPTTVGNIEKPIFVADSATSGYVINYRGKIIPSTTIPQLVSFKYFTAGAGNYVPNVSVKSILVELAGAGGGGGGAKSAAGESSAGGGGGAGGYGRKFIAPVSGVYAYSVGVGGTAGVAANGAGGNGGNTTFDIYTAGGGSGGQGGTTTAAAGGNSNGGGGGTVVGMDLNVPGRNGYGGLIYVATSTAEGGQGGETHFGYPGTGGFAVGIDSGGGSGFPYGGGGGGAASNNSAVGAAAGAGAGGAIIIWEFI